MHYICPVCKSDNIVISQNNYLCEDCKKTFRIFENIPDFRIYPFPYSDKEESDADILLKNYNKMDYLNLYRLRQSFFIDRSKSEDSIRKVKELHEESLKNLIGYHMDCSNIFSKNMHIFRYIVGARITHEKEMSLELGCGRGTQIPDMLSAYENVVAVDNSLCELIIAKKLIDQKGLGSRVRFICACCESLPFMNESFNVINMRSVLEHVEDQVLSLQETRRVLKNGGTLLLETPNRFTFHKEPHVKVYGVGFMPRKWMKKYVDVMTHGQLTFGGTKSLSYFELKAVLKKAFDTNWEHRACLIDESRQGVTVLGKIYRKFDFVKNAIECLPVKSFCDTHFVAAWKA